MHNKISSLLVMALMAIGLMSCDSKSTHGIISWNFETTCDNAEVDADVTSRLETVMKDAYQPLGTYTPGYTEESGAQYNSRVKTAKQPEEEIRTQVAAATVVVEEALKDFDFSTIGQCHITVTLYIKNSPSPMLDREFVLNVER